MKTLLVSLLFALSACAVAPGIKVVTTQEGIKGCEGIPTFAPITCKQEKSCEECLKGLSEEVGKLGGNTMLLEHSGKECKPQELTATPFKC